MYLAMVAKIVFPKTEHREELVINQPESVKIESGWEMLTDKATITMARNVHVFDKNRVRDLFKREDKVIIHLGYNGVLIKEFEGVITKVTADTPVVIECEDIMYLLKKHPVNISLKSANLTTLIEKIVPEGFKTEVFDVDLGTKRFPKTTVSKVLEKLQEDYNLYSYIKNGDTLVVGKIYSDDTEVETFDFNINVVSNGLKYKRKEDIQIEVEAISTLKSGGKIEVKIGDENGEKRQLSYYNITDKEKLKELAEIDYAKYKIDGFEGNIVTWGIPSVQHGWKALVVSKQYPDRSGTYYIKRVTKIFDSSPKYRQTIELDKRVA